MSVSGEDPSIFMMCIVSELGNNVMEEKKQRVQVMDVRFELFFFMAYT